MQGVDMLYLLLGILTFALLLGLTHAVSRLERRS
jgi:hypothetical protein